MSNSAVVGDAGPKRERWRRVSPTRREGWGLALIAFALLSFWWAAEGWENWGPASDEGVLVFYFLGLSQESARGWLFIASAVAAPVALLFLVPPLVGRVRRRVLRLAVGWMAALAVLLALAVFVLTFIFGFAFAVGITDYVHFRSEDGTSLLVSQDGFDGDSVGFYTKYDTFHYVGASAVNSPSDMGRIANLDCQLTRSAELLHLTCGSDVVEIDPR